MLQRSKTKRRREINPGPYRLRRMISSGQITTLATLRKLWVDFLLKAIIFVQTSPWKFLKIKRSGPSASGRATPLRNPVSLQLGIPDNVRGHDVFELFHFENHDLFHCCFLLKKCWKLTSLLLTSLLHRSFLWGNSKLILCARTWSSLAKPSFPWTHFPPHHWGKTYTVLESMPWKALQESFFHLHPTRYCFNWTWHFLFLKNERKPINQFVFHS